MLSRMLSITAIAGGLSLAGAGIAAAQAMPMQHPKGSQRTITGAGRARFRSPRSSGSPEARRPWGA